MDLSGFVSEVCVVPVDPRKHYKKLESLSSAANNWTVIKAEHLASKTQVALKFKYNKGRGRDWVTDACTEAYIMREVLPKHPNILRLHNCFVSVDKEIIMELELADNVLHRFIMEHNGKVPVSKVKHVMRELLCALKFCHSRNVIHGDVKPENIMIFHDATQRQNMHIKLGDFDCSLIVPPNCVCQNYYMVNTDFMKPEEILLENRTFDDRVDVHAAACTMLMMLDTHKYPFKPIRPSMAIDPGQERDRAVASRHAQLEQLLHFFDNSDQLLEHVPDDALELVTGMLERDYENRYTSAAALVNVFFCIHNQ